MSTRKGAPKDEDSDILKLLKLLEESDAALMASLSELADVQIDVSLWEPMPIVEWDVAPLIEWDVNPLPDGKTLEEMDREVIVSTVELIRDYERKHGILTPASRAAAEREGRHSISHRHSLRILKRLLMDRGVWNDADEAKRRQEAQAAPIHTKTAPAAQDTKGHKEG